MNQSLTEVGSSQLSITSSSQCLLLTRLWTLSIGPSSIVMCCVLCKKRCAWPVGCRWTHSRDCGVFFDGKKSVLGEVFGRWRSCRFRSVNSWRKMRLSGPGFLKIMIWISKNKQIRLPGKVTFAVVGRVQYRGLWIILPKKLYTCKNSEIQTASFSNNRIGDSFIILILYLLSLVYDKLISEFFSFTFEDKTPTQSQKISWVQFLALNTTTTTTTINNSNYNNNRAVSAT